MIEEWRDVVGYEGLYEVSNLGNVRSKEKISVVVFGKLKGRQQHRKGKDIKINHANKGYSQVHLTKNRCGRTERVARLVAQAFIPNPDNLPFVNHKDENRSNDCVDNLEWCTHEYNCNYGNRKKRIAKAHSKPIVQCDMLGVFIRRWDSISDVTRTYGFEQSNLCKALNGKYSNAYGYVWKYVKTNNNLKEGEYYND